jgi:hypothetical protein
VETQLSFALFKPLEIQVSGNRQRSTKGFPFEFELRNNLVQEMGSSIKGPKNPTT